MTDRILVVDETGVRIRRYGPHLLHANNASTHGRSQAV
jgi:UDP-galactopyranose mutase